MKFLVKQVFQYKGADWELVEMHNSIIKCLLYVAAILIINLVECWSKKEQNTLHMDVICTSQLTFPTLSFSISLDCKSITTN